MLLFILIAKRRGSNLYLALVFSKNASCGDGSTSQKHDFAQMLDFPGIPKATLEATFFAIRNTIFSFLLSTMGRPFLEELGGLGPGIWVARHPHMSG